MATVEAAWRRVIILGQFFGLLLVANVPAVAMRSWQAMKQQPAHAASWHYCAACALGNAAVRSAGSARA